MVVEKEPLSVLIIEDDDDDFFIARRLLAKTTEVRPAIERARGYEEGLVAVTAGRYDISLVDYRLGPRNGLDLLQEARARGCRTPMILLTGQGDRRVDLKAMVAGAADYLVKWEFDAQLLERSIRYARERSRAEERIREQAALLDKARDAILALDLDGRVIYWNKSAERLTGWREEEMRGVVAAERLYERGDPTLQEAQRIVRGQGEWAGELHQRTKEGDAIVVESRWTLVRDGTGTPQSILVINTDVTERKQLELQFLRAQRMESIGRLVSGIAHDLGNLLVPILLGVRVLRQRHDDERTLRTLTMMEQSAQRGSNMVEQVLAFARGVEGERAPLRPARVVEEVEKITRETFPRTIDVDVQVAEGLWSVIGDATQLQQVLMNLCVNARDAMAAGGRLAIRVTNMVIDEVRARHHIEASPGDYVCVSVADTGSGIPPEVQDKIFEPFFTTKEIGKGTGLGLSSVYSIVKSHGGFVHLESELGKGTAFHIYLPASGKEEALPPSEEPHLHRPGRGELVLLVDDEAPIRELVQEILEEASYRVMTAENGKEAVHLLQAHIADVKAVITDIMMPEMNGLDVIRIVRERWPALPIAGASGMPEGNAQEALEAGARLFLKKPFTAEKLLLALGELLGEKQGDGVP